eukprot:scaffold11932_cov64-Phaeocystis_antarctica.AAC.3
MGPEAFVRAICRTRPAVSRFRWPEEDVTLSLSLSLTRWSRATSTCSSPQRRSGRGSFTAHAAGRAAEFRICSSLPRQTDQDSPISCSWRATGRAAAGSECAGSQLATRPTAPAA